jgi:hypothetical protein
LINVDCWVEQVKLQEDDGDMDAEGGTEFEGINAAGASQ